MTDRYHKVAVPTLVLIVWLCGTLVLTPYGLAQSAQWLTPTAPIVSWTKASSYVGQTVTVEGTIVSAYSSSGTTFLQFPYQPNQGYTSHFLGVVLSSDAGNFKCSITGFYVSKDVRITGTVQLYNGGPAIIVHGPSQIEVAYQGFPCS